MSKELLVSSDLVGVWSTGTLCNPEDQSDEILVIKSDGTGWIEVRDFCLRSVHYFEWQDTSSGWVVMAGIESFEWDIKSWMLIQSTNIWGVDHSSYRVREEDTPIGQKLKVLRISLFSLGEKAFGLLNRNADSRAKPTG